MVIIELDREAPLLRTALPAEADGFLLKEEPVTSVDLENLSERSVP
jgi:hypothetical protein